MEKRPEDAEDGKAEALSFEEARERLRARGYLDRGVEGAVLKGVLSSRSRARGVLNGAAVAATLLATALAASDAVILSVAAALPVKDGLVLFLWLLLGSLLLALVLVAALGGVAWLRLSSRAGSEHAPAEMGVVLGLLAALFGALTALPALDGAAPLAAVFAVLSVAVAVFVAARVARGLTTALLVSRGKAVLGRARATGLPGAGIAIVATVALLVAFFVRRGQEPPDEPLVVTANTRRAIVVGLDGYSDRFLPAATRALPAGTPYLKTSRDPAAFWTSVATGESARRHGVGALDLVRVAGVSAPLRPRGASALYLGKVLPALGLARRESVTSAARRVPALWEVAHRAGIPSLAVSWWTTYPAGDGGGTVLSNHLYFAARSGGPLVGEAWPEEAGVRAAKLVPRRGGEQGVARLVADAEGWDAFVLASFREAWVTDRPRLGLLYLPGLDILASALAEADRDAGDRVALANALSGEAARLATFVREELPGLGADLTVTVLDGGRESAGGSIAFGGPLAAPAPPGLKLAPEDVAPTVLAALGVPSARDLTGRPQPAVLAQGASGGATVASWGRRRALAAPPIDPKAYVENLRSLGYLK
ncbi:MAG: hypothetical protein JNK60_01955 [Acidobacteria bacterium]|nr:hypothetical protein [Acidobacteriota bacterium]